MRNAPFFLLPFLVSLAVAQEPQSPGRALDPVAEPEKPPRELLAAEMMRFRARKDIVLNATIERKQPEAAAPGQPGQPGNVVQVVVQGPGAAAGEPYEGRVEAWRDAEGTTVIVSKTELPGFGLYVMPERTVRRVTTSGKTPDTDELRTELMSLLEGERLAKHVLAAQLEHRVEEGTGDHVWRGTVDKNIVRPVERGGVDPRIGMVLPGLFPRVLRTDLELRLSKDGVLKALRLTVVRNDPQQELLRNGGGVRRIVLGGNGLPQAPQQHEEGDPKHDVEGVSTVYALDFTASKPSDRATAFKRDMRRMLGGE